MPYGGKKGEVHLTSTCLVDTGLTLIQSAFTQQNIYSQAAAFAIANPTSYTHLLIKYWEEPCVVSCGSELVTMNGRSPKNIPKNAFKVDKYTSVEINIAGVNTNNEGFYLESKDLPEEIKFPLKDTNIKQK
ncbi:26970_t:CDS:2 [Gigaspora margarita]|uniref:26970_t:CDS:1 n=1 Tax=Gigaspora margarita TaxID=4874 RepID=A0ABN7UNZ7_GIGMA|nr:26970_t:CDS:2 [Gigaspora margarita]